MAELTHFYDEENTAGARTTATWSNTVTSGTAPAQILGSSLAANTKYLIVARALIGSSTTSRVHGVRVQTDDDSTIETKSESAVEFQQFSANQSMAYLFVHSYTTDASPADVEFQLLSSGGSRESRIDQSSLFLLDLGAIGSEGTDYYEDIQAVDTGTEYSTSAATTVLAQLSGVDLGTDEFLILGYARADIGSVSRWFDHSLHLAYDASSSSEASRHRAEGEDTTEQRIVGFAVRHQASSGTPNVTLYGQEEAADANMTDGGAYLIALPTSLFADFVDDYTAGAIAIDGTETTIATSGSYTPTVTGNHLIIGRTQGSAQPTRYGAMWVESTTTEIRTGDSAHNQTQIWDNTKDDEYMATLQRYSITTAETFNLRSQGVTADFDVEDRWLIVVNLNEPGGGAATVTPGVIARSFTVDAVTVKGAARPEPAVTARSFTVDAVTAKGAAKAEPAATARSFTVDAVTVKGSAKPEPATIARSFTVDAATPVAPVTVTPGLTARSFTVDAVTVKGSASPEPAVIARSFTVDTPTVAAGVVVVPAVTAQSFGLDQVSIAAPRTVSPAVTARSFTVDAVTVKGSAVVVPAATARSFVLPAPSLAGGAVVVPAATSNSFTVPAVTVVGGAAVTPAVTTLAFTVDAVTVRGSAVTVPAVTARSFLLPQATPTNTDAGGAATVEPAAIARSFTVDAATVSGGAVATPDQLAAVVTMPLVTLIGPAVTTPGSITAVFTVPAASTAGAAGPSPATVIIAATVYAPTVKGQAVVDIALAALEVAIPQVSAFKFTTSGVKQDGGIATSAQTGGISVNRQRAGAAASSQTGDASSNRQTGATQKSGSNS